MKLSRGFIPTLKEIPAYAVIKSHRLMLRSGMIRSHGAGIYSYLPFFYRSIKKVISIIREEMDKIGCQELLLPALNPVEVWRETGRHNDFGQEKFNFQDRRGHELCLAPTHEEIICDLARREIRSYRDLPQVWYQIQTKFRDEPRPRSGVLRTRQFLMKDAYSLDSSWEGLDNNYLAQKGAYQRIFQRCGLDYFIVGASSGVMGSGDSEEFMVESASGEDTCAKCSRCDYSDNIEVAQSKMKYQFGQGGNTPVEVHTPDKKTIEEVSTFLRKEPRFFLKALFYIADESPLMVLIAGPDELNEIKLGSALGKPVRPAHPDEVIKYMGTPAGFIGPVRLPENIPLYADAALKDARGMVCGANKIDYHLVEVDVGVHTRQPDYRDLRTVREGEHCPKCGAPLRVVRAIELGHIFKLGTKYSSAMGANFLDPKGVAKPIIMGSYGIGVERIIAANIEQRADDKGMNWRCQIAPYLTIILPLNNRDDDLVAAAEKLYHDLSDAGLEPVIDDRDIRAGVKFKDAELLGIPVQVIFGRDFSKGKIELKLRAAGESKIVELNEAVEEIKILCSALP